MPAMRKWFTAQIALLTAGTVFAWYNVVKNFVRFYHFEGTLFKVKDCVIPNPVTEPCFYGAIGFLVALIWASIALRNFLGRGPAAAKKIQHYLWWFLAAGTIFAWFNVTKEFVAFYTAKNGPALGCSATPITNPYLTPCFTGASIFLISVIIAGIAYNQLKKGASNDILPRS